MSNQEEYALSVEEAAKRLNISKTYAYQMARSGELPTMRLGGRILVPVASLRSWLAGGVNEARDE